MPSAAAELNLGAGWGIRPQGTNFDRYRKGGTWEMPMLRFLFEFFLLPFLLTDDRDTSDDCWRER